jgi:uncharacterized protein (TIGR02217 family)
MPQAFDNIRFPVAISRGATGGPERRTDIVTLASGREERNSRWADARRRYNAGFGVKSLDDLHELIRFFEERRGRLHGFRWKDHADWKSCPPLQPITPFDQLLGEGDGTTAAFQLVKRYGSGLRDQIRKITLPVADTVRVAVAGVETAAFSLDDANGVISFAAGHVPGAGAAVTAGFAFDVPVRFDTDHLAINLESFTAGVIPDIAIIEIKP